MPDEEIRDAHRFHRGDPGRGGDWRLARRKKGSTMKKRCGYCNDACQWHLCAWCWTGAALAAIGTTVVAALANDFLAWTLGR